MKKQNYPWLLFLFWILFFVNLHAQVPGRISGFVRDARSGEPVMYANLILEGSSIGAASDVHGYFVIARIPAGEYTLKAMMMGYETQQEQVTIQSATDLRVDFEMPIKVLEGEEVTVTAERTRFEKKVEISRTNLSFREIHSGPVFVESDVFRTLQMMPSVQASNDFSSALVVRGGSPDENLILLDGIEVYNPYHLGGFFSTFNTDALADAEFVAGGFPASFGNRTSSVLQITSKEGNSKNHRLGKDTKWGEYWDLSELRGEISMLSTKVLAEGPIKNGSWMFSTRRSYYDQLARLYFLLKGEDNDWAYYLWDMQGKVIYDFSKTHRLTLSAYKGRDVFKVDLDISDDEHAGIDMDWGNATRSAEWRWVPNSRFASYFSVAYTQYDWDMDLEFTQIDSTVGEFSNRIREDVGIEDMTIKEKLDWYVSDRHTLSTGFEYKILDMRYHFQLGDLTLFHRKQSPYIFSVFVQDKWQPSALFSLQTGLRVSKYELHDRLYAEPRLGFKYLLTHNLALKASWGIYKQFLFTNVDDEELVNFVDVWLPISKEIRPKSAQHFIVGLEQWLGEGFYASVEAYYKPYSNVIVKNPGNDPARQDDDFIEGSGQAYGFEVLLKRSIGRWFGWLGYAYSRLEREIDFNNDAEVIRADGEIYNPKYDRPHNLNGVLNFQLNDKHSFGLTVSLSSGMPYTPVIGYTYSQSGMGDARNPYANIRNIEGRRNSARYPAYFRADISWARSLNWFGWEGRFKFQVTNVTNHFNTLIYVWDHEHSPSRVTRYSMFPILPTLGIEFKL